MGETSTQSPIVFFDGVCALCNSSVNFLMRIDKKRKIRFAPLQGITAKEVLKEEIRKDFDSLVLYRGGDIFKYSTGVLTIMKIIGGRWGLFYAFIIVPPFIRNSIYRLIARNRYKWFGEYDTCRVASPEEKGVILD